MSADPKPADTAAAAAAPAPKKSSAIGGLLKILVPAILAAGAAYGGSRAAAAHGAAPVAEEQHHKELPPPGPTEALEPFLVTINDAKGKGHVMKVSVAIEFEKPEKPGGEEKESVMKPFALRIRDGILSYLRALSYEEAADGAHMEKVRNEMLERCHGAGATTAVRVLITDFVLQ